MKHIWKSTVVLLAMSILLGMTAMASEVVPTVSFSGKTETFTFANTAISVDAEGKEVPDLFTELKDVMPGDTITQNISMKTTDMRNCDEVRIFLKSETTDPVYLDLLDQIHVKVKNGSEDITAKMSDTVLLGDFAADSTTDITVEVEFPITLGNEVKNLKAKTDWIFIAEIMEDANPPKTGDTNTMIPYMLLIAASATLGVWMIKRRVSVTE